VHPVAGKAGSGCSHYAGPFIAVVKALGLIDKPEHLLYVISCAANNYNRALEKMDNVATMNGHQLVLVKIASKRIDINMSKSKRVEMAEGFSPDYIKPPQNIPISFASYPDVAFLLRKIGKDYDDRDDNSLTGLMNTYRSGQAQSPDFKWGKSIDIDNRNT
jgi:hypothetical protein